VEKNYQNLTLQQDCIDTYLSEFFSQYTNYLTRDDNVTAAKRTIKFGHVGVDDATVILFFKAKGTTTIQYKTGKNHGLGEVLASFLVDKIDPSDSSTINLSIKGFNAENVQIVLDDLTEMKDTDENLHFNITVHQPNTYSTKYEIVSNKYKDRLNVTHHRTTDVLQVQGRPLFCYKSLSYSLSIMLDQASLLSVISKTSAEDQLLVREEVACSLVKEIYPVSFERMESVYQNLLVSSYCVKLASPRLPEYSMLLFADLRVLEGVIKETLMHYGKYTNSDNLDIGHFFSCTPTSNSIKNIHLSDFDCSSTISALEDCYLLYRQQRHSLFHMEDLAFTSRVISTLGEVMSLSKDIASKLESLYQSCSRL
jgi:hypothetical protein